jgi:hypothetical protein
MGKKERSGRRVNEIDLSKLHEERGTITSQNESAEVLATQIKELARLGKKASGGKCGKIHR